MVAQTYEVYLQVEKYIKSELWTSEIFFSREY